MRRVLLFAGLGVALLVAAVAAMSLVGSQGFAANDRPGPPPSAGAALVGDASCDGTINAVDAALILLSNARLGVLGCAADADVDGDGEITSADAALILQAESGLTELPPSVVGLALSTACDSCAVTVGSAVAVGGQATVDVHALNVDPPGLGAWTIDISYDNSIMDASDCTANAGGVCNENFSPTSARITGASAGGLEGDTDLGSFTFDCLAEGISPLTISVPIFHDATIGDPQFMDPEIINGSIDCSDGPPPTPPPPPPPDDFHAHWACRQIRTGELRDTGIEADSEEPTCARGWELVQILISH